LGAPPLRIDRDDDALVAELVSGFSNEIRVVDGGRIDRNLVRAAKQQFANVSDGANAAADGDRHEALLGGTSHDVEDCFAIVRGSGDVEKAEFVGAGSIVSLRGLDRISGVYQIDEVDTFDDAAVLDVEAGNDAGLQGH
jgi:hypothetical protein